MRIYIFLRVSFFIYFLYIPSYVYLFFIMHVYLFSLIIFCTVKNLDFPSRSYSARSIVQTIVVFPSSGISCLLYINSYAYTHLLPFCTRLLLQFLARLNSNLLSIVTHDRARRSGARTRECSNEYISISVSRAPFESSASRNMKCHLLEHIAQCIQTSRSIENPHL